MENRLGKQCTAKAKSTGERCKRPAQLGGSVCRFHGGAAPQSQEANARRVLSLLVGPALAELRNLIENPQIPPGVKLNAVRDVLDRAGIKAEEKPEDDAFTLLVKGISRTALYDAED